MQDIEAMKSSPMGGVLMAWGVHISLYYCMPLQPMSTSKKHLPLAWVTSICNTATLVTNM
jgi:hypothetical protein